MTNPEPAILATNFLIVYPDGEPKTMRVTEPTPGDFEFADVGMCEILRLPDLRRYESGAWHEIPAGRLITADTAEIPDTRPFHAVPDNF